ncbi:hypothetical protein LSAT2_019433 [Lamellibrachia satsuma]|nr:hypothetical protein LSAT2_019433 [Lamellibrachia satsuma]
MLTKGMDREKAQMFLQQSIAQMCKVTVSFAGPIEIDGIICITGCDKDDLVLVKLHEKLTSPAMPGLDTSDCESEDVLCTDDQDKCTLTSDLCRSTESVDPDGFVQEYFKSENNCVSSDVVYENVTHQTSVSELEDRTYRTEAVPSTSGTLNIMAHTEDIKIEPILLDSDYEDSVDILDSPDQPESSSFTDSVRSTKRTVSADFDPTEPVAKVMNQGVVGEHAATLQVTNMELNDRLLELTSAPAVTQTASSDTSQSCSLCGHVFNGFVPLRQHMASVHQQLICEQCLKLFLHPNKLHQHMRLHLSTVHWLCTICRRSFRRKEHLCHHISCHQNMQLHQCGQCNKGFTARSMLQLHLERQHGSKTEHVCKPCFMEFTDTATFAKHEKHHRQCEVQYTCQQCGFTGDDRLSVVKHGFSHFGLRIDPTSKTQVP